jgi:adenine-specific DNA-methyltransferase
VIASIGADLSNVAPKALSEMLRATRPSHRSPIPHGVRTATVEKWFRGKDPWPCHSPEQLALLRNLEDRFPTIEVGAKVGIGVATGNDAVFITEDRHLV